MRLTAAQRTQTGQPDGEQIAAAPHASHRGLRWAILGWTGSHAAESYGALTRRLPCSPAKRPAPRRDARREYSYPGGSGGIKHGLEPDRGYKTETWITERNNCSLMTPQSNWTPWSFAACHGDGRGRALFAPPAPCSLQRTRAGEASGRFLGGVRGVTKPTTTGATRAR